MPGAAVSGRSVERDAAGERQFEAVVPLASLADLALKIACHDQARSRCA
jgi:hypothetical protein